MCIGVLLSGFGDGALLVRGFVVSLGRDESGQDVGADSCGRPQLRVGVGIVDDGAGQETPIEIRRRRRAG